MTIGEIIKKYREEHGLSQRQFAEKCGDITNGYISMIEQGKNPSTGKPIVPSIDKVALLARGMGMSLHQLIEVADDSLVYIGGNEDDMPVKKNASKEYTSPQTDEARFVSGWMDYQPEPLRKFLQNMVLAVILNSPEHVDINDLHKQ